MLNFFFVSALLIINCKAICKANENDRSLAKSVRHLAQCSYLVHIWMPYFCQKSN